MDDLIYGEWQSEFRAAIAGTNPHAREVRIMAAEALMSRRLHEIADTPDHNAERLAIADAFASLRVLKREA